MTATKTAEPKPDVKPAGPASPPVEISMEWIAPAAIAPSPTNPRKFFDLVSLGELAESFRVHGVLQPLLVRRKGSGFELVAGERRWRAAKDAGLPKIPCVIRTVTDEQVLEMQLIENRQRKDVTELEEARGFKALMKFDPKKWTAASIAQRIGLSEKYVWDRMRLLALIDPAQELLDRGKITASHAILIARLKPEQQAVVVKVPPAAPRWGSRADREGGLWECEDTGPYSSKEQSSRLIDILDDKKDGDKYQGWKAKSIRELDDYIANHFRFDPAQAAAAAPLLFAGVKAQVDAAEAKPGRRKKWVHITHRHLAEDSVRKDGGDRVYGSQSWKRADAKTCDRSCLGVVGAGPVFNNERAFQVCVDRDCKVHFWKLKRAPTPRPAASVSSGMSAAERKKIDERNARHAAEQRKRELEKAQFDKLAPKLMRSVVELVRRSTARVLIDYAEQYLDQVGLEGLGDAAAHLGIKTCRTAEDLVHLLVMARITETTEYEADSIASFTKAVEPFHGGIAAVVKEVQASADKAGATARAASVARNEKVKKQIAAQVAKKAAAKKAKPKVATKAGKKPLRKAA